MTIGLFASLVQELLLFLIVCVRRIVDGVMQSATLLTLQGEAGDEVAHVNHVAELTDILRRFYTFEEVLSFFVKGIKAHPGTMQAQVGTDDAHIVGHNLAHLLDTLRDKHLFFIGQRTLIIPFRHLIVEIV